MLLQLAYSSLTIVLPSDQYWCSVTSLGAAALALFLHRLQPSSPAFAIASLDTRRSQMTSLEQGKQTEEIKQRTQETWTKAAASYSEWVIENQLLLGLYPRFEALLVPQLKDVAGARILDVASASGEPAATLAAALPQAEVLSTDLAAPFLELGRARAAKAGLQNLSFETVDAEDLRCYGDASFDAVTCSLALMMMPNHNAALREFCRVLKPGGVFAAALWMSEDRVPFFHITKQLAVEYDAANVLAAASFAERFANPSAGLLQDLSAAGLADVQLEELEVEYTMPAGLWWKGLLEMPLPIKPALVKAQQQGPGEDLFEEARLKMSRMLAEHSCLTPEGVLHCKNNGCWFITARKPDAA